MSKVISLLGAALLVASCGSAKRPPIAEPSEPVSPPAPSVEPVRTSPPAPTPPLVAVVEPAALAELSRQGFTLGELAVGVKATTTSELARNPGMKSIFTALARDVTETASAQPPARVTSSDGIRIFDVEWLASPEMSFELVGVFNRIDRRAFYDSTCGEVRFLYRLAFRTQHGGETMASRLPLMINVVFLTPGERCAETAQAWRAPPSAKGAELANWLATTGPLSPQRRERWTLKSIEADLQRLRIQSFSHPTLAGHIEYGMFVFHATDETRTKFAPAPMENMPDVAALKKDAKRRTELLAYLKKPEILTAIDTGVLRLPDRFLAKHATSVSPRGLERPQNRPFQQLFAPSDFADVELANTSTIRSGAALLRRLEGASCTGCHQSRAIAGFHFVGEDGPDELRGAALLRGSSPHLIDDLQRRRTYVDRVALGEAPDEQRPIPERQGVGQGFGAPCGLGDPGFADWTCAEGLHCQKLEDAEVGICTGEPALASPCEYGKLVTSSRPQSDHVTDMVRPGCGGGLSCDTNKSGFPLGACAGRCSSGADTSCADFVDTDALQVCLRQKKPYAACNAQSMIHPGMRACDDARPCRQDYVCARVGKEPVGACVPPYFMFPLRLDGYPLQR
jgi:hypothetical protein